MSVIAYEQQEYENIAYSVKHNKVLRDAILYTDIYRQAAQSNWSKEPEEKLIDDIIDRLFWYLMVCNRVVYLLQYQEEGKTTNIVEYTENMTHTALYTNYVLFSKLERIDYNLTTNDGNRIVPENWIKVFYRIKQRLAEDMVYRSNEHTETYAN